MMELQAHKTMTPKPDDDIVTILTPIMSELQRALSIVLAVGFGQVVLHVEHGVVQRVVFSCSFKRKGLTSASDSGNLELDNKI